MKEGMGHQEDVLCAVLVGNATSRDRAERIARSSRKCPYVALYVADDCLVVGVFAIPVSKRRWIEYPQEHPELLGLEAVVVHVTDGIRASSPWSRGVVEAVLEEAPCGTDCRSCPQYGTRCDGCPATGWYCRTETAR